MTEIDEDEELQWALEMSITPTPHETKDKKLIHITGSPFFFELSNQPIPKGPAWFIETNETDDDVLRENEQFSTSLFGTCRYRQMQRGLVYEWIQKPKDLAVIKD